jgi:RNA polymerase sigma-70 factor (ECF subfamily)
MSPEDSLAESNFPGAGKFATTHWSLVAAARDPTASAARDALAALCSTYWYPLYVFIRRQGYRADQAQDLTQELFARLLEKNFLRGVDRGKGKFRSFLLAACKHFLANERDRARAAKRGGGKPLLSLDFSGAESRYHREPASADTPEKLFERRWALTVLEQVLARLGGEFARAGKGKDFEGLKGFLTGGKDSVPYATLAAQWGTSAGAVKVAVHRLRKRYRELLREEIARTLDQDGRVEDEIRDLFAALGS